MKLKSWLLALAITTVPSLALAEDEPKPTETTEEETTETKTTETKETTDTTMKEEEAEQEKKDEKMVRVRAHIVPAVAGIEAADKAVAALYELSGDEQLRPQDARRTVALAKQGLAMSIERINALEDVADLSDDAKSEANRASTKLQEAKTTVTRLEKQISKKGTISRNTAEQIRSDAKDLHTDLSDAGNAVEQVAKAYDVPTDLEFGG